MTCAAVAKIDIRNPTKYGDVIEGGEVYGVVTFTVNDLRRDDCPV